MVLYTLFVGIVYFFKQKTAYNMRISDWSSDVCSSDLIATEMVRAVPAEVLNSKILPLIPAGRLGEPEEIARCVVFLAAEEAGFITGATRSEEHTSELQSLMRISYAVFCLKKKQKKIPSFNHPCNNVNIIIQLENITTSREH